MGHLRLKLPIGNWSKSHALRLCFGFGLAGTLISGTATHAQTYDETKLGLLTVPIQNWNMVASQYWSVWIGDGTPYPFPTGVEVKNIISVSATIYNDARTRAEPLSHLGHNLSVVQHDPTRGGYYILRCQDAGSQPKCQVLLDRSFTDYTYFTSEGRGPNYDGTGFRGYINIQYVGSSASSGRRIYKRIGTWSIPEDNVSGYLPPIDKPVNLGGTPGSTTLLDMDAMLRSDPLSSDPENIWLDAFGIPQNGSSQSQVPGTEEYPFWGRGGVLWGTSGSINLHIPRSHGQLGNTMNSRFHKGLHDGNSVNRGWVRITTTSPNSYTNPFFIKSLILPMGPTNMSAIGGGTGKMLFGHPFPQTRIVEVTATLFKDPQTGFDIKDISPFNRMPFPMSPGGSGGPRIGGRVMVQPNRLITLGFSLNFTDVPLEGFFSTPDKFSAVSFNGQPYNRGWIRLDYLAAECNEGNTQNPYTKSAIGSFGQNSNDCYGNYGVNQHHVIQTKGPNLAPQTTSDAFYYVHKPLPTNTNTFEVRLDDVENTSSTAMAGLMIRQAPTSGSTPSTNGSYLALMVTPSQEIQLLRRFNTSQVQASELIVSSLGGSIKPPHRLRLIRESSTSWRAEVIHPDGSTTWMSTVPMPNVSYRVGMAVSNGNAGSSLCTAGFTASTF